MPAALTQAKAAVMPHAVLPAQGVVMTYVVRQAQAAVTPYAVLPAQAAVMPYAVLPVRAAVMPYAVLPEQGAVMPQAVPLAELQKLISPQAARFHRSRSAEEVALVVWDLDCFEPDCFEQDRSALVCLGSGRDGWAQSARLPADPPASGACAQDLQ